MSLYSMYAQGIKDSVNNTYNLLVSGGSDYPKSSGIILGNSTISGASTSIYQDNSSNAYIDFRSNASNSLSMRYTANNSTFNNMLTLMNDDKSSNSLNAATVNGRMSASQFVATGDSRLPSQKGLYMSQSNGTAQLSVAGNGGFVLSNYYSNGTLNNNALVLNPNGSVLTPYYNQTANGGDNESSAIVTLDSSGNLVRGWNMNQRLRLNEQNTETIYNVLNAGLPNKINNIISRLNNLNFYNPNLPPLDPISVSSNAPVPTPTPNPFMSMYGEWIQTQWTAPKVLGSYQIAPRYGVASSVIKAFSLLGSNDGLNWYFIHSTSSPLMWSTNASNTFYVNPVQAYSYYRLVVTQATSPAEIGGLYMYDVSGNAFALSSATSSGANNQYLQQSGSTVCTLSWSWLDSVQSSSLQKSYILTPTNYSTTYLGFSQPSEYPSNNNGLVNTSAPVTSYSFLKNVSNIVSSYGEWVQVAFANSFVPASIAIYPKSGSMNVPQSFILLGLIGSTWNYLTSATNLIWSSNTPFTFYVPTADLYSSYRIVVTQALTSAWNIGGLIFYSSSGLVLPNSYTYSGTNNSIVNGTSVGSTSISGDWYQVQYPASFILSSYQIGSRYDLNTNSSIGQNRTANAFSVIGSNDGTSWNLLDTKTNQNAWYNGSLNTFTVSNNSTAYSYYRFIMTQMNAAPYAIWEIANINMFAGNTMWPPTQITNSTWTSGATSTTGTLTGQSYGNGNYIISSSMTGANIYYMSAQILGKTTASSSGQTTPFIAGNMSYNTSGGYTGSNTKSVQTIVVGGVSATLTWSWSVMDGSPTNTGAILVSPLTTWVGVSDSSKYPSSNNGFAVASAANVSYTNAPLPSLITQTVNGEWIQIQLAAAQLITSFQLVPYASNSMFQSFYLLGSTDGSVWDYLMNNTNTILWSTKVPLSFNVMSVKAYSYYRLVVTQGPVPFNLSGFILISSSGSPVLSSYASYTVSGANNNILQSSGVTQATLTWSWTNAYTQSTSQIVASLMTNNGYSVTSAYLGCTNSAEYPSANNGFATTAAPLITYNYSIP